MAMKKKAVEVGREEVTKTQSLAAAAMMEVRRRGGVWLAVVAAAVTGLS